MVNRNRVAAQADEAVIIRTREERELERITRPDVQAVIYSPPALPAWFTALAAAVRNGSFRIPRTILSNASADELRNWLGAHLPTGGLDPEVHAALQQDIISLVDRLGVTTGAVRFMLRILTGTPNTECGFHVDTVPPRAPTWGLMRLYNGAGTAYVDPSNVISMDAVYRYLSRRERLARERVAARDDPTASAHLERAIAQLDAERAFLKQPSDVHLAPAGSIVAFKHIDIRLHWSHHPTAMAWIHCSPMEGEPRLLVNVTAWAPGLARRGTHESAR